VKTHELPVVRFQPNFGLKNKFRTNVQVKETVSVKFSVLWNVCSVLLLL